MKKSPHRLKHEQRKAIRQAQKETPYETEKSEIKKTRTHLSSPRKVKISKAKASSKHQHHMTSPRDVDFKTEPESIHKESTHWIRVIQKQTLDTAKRLQKKFQKFNFLRRK